MENQIILINIPLEKLTEIIRDCVSQAISDKPSVSHKLESQEDLLSLEDLQKIFNVSKVTIHKWKKKGLIPFYKMNRRIYFKKTEVIDSMTHKRRKLEL